MFIGNKKISQGKLVLKYLVENPNEYNSYAFKDGNTMNCHPSNIIPISKDADAIKRKFHINSRKNIVLAVNSRDYAIENSQDESVREYYRTGNKAIIDNIFSDLFKKSYNNKLNSVLGILYIKVWERLQRFSLLYCPRKFVLSVYKKYVGYESLNHYEWSPHYH